MSRNWHWRKDYPTSSRQVRNQCYQLEILLIWSTKVPSIKYTVQTIEWNELYWRTRLIGNIFRRFHLLLNWKPFANCFVSISSRNHFYLPQRSWGKVIFSETCVKYSVHILEQSMLGYGQPAGGTHPTGMHTWCYKFLF